MTRLHYPNQPFSPAPSHSFFLDTSFIIAGIGKRPQCYALLDSLLGHPLHLSELVWAEALHVLTKTLVGNDFRALLWGRPRDLLNPEAALALRDLGLSRKEYKDRLVFEAVYSDVLKRGTLGEKALLVPYQNLAAAALQTFVDRTEAETLGLGGEDRLMAGNLMRQVPLDSYDALHLAVAFRAGCSHLVTRDADFGLASEVCPVAVLQVA